MRLTNKPITYSTARQLKLPLDLEKIINISDPVYTFCDVMDHIDLTPYFAEEGCKTGRPRCDAKKLLEVILFAFMENGISSLRDLEKLCRNDIRYMYLLDDMPAPSHATFGNFIRNELTTSIEGIFNDINTYIFETDHVDLEHTYIDGTKIEANANRYTWVWKKSCIKNRRKVFEKLSTLIDEMNTTTLCLMGVKLENREVYEINYVEEMLENYRHAINLDVSTFVSGIGHRKSLQQRQYQSMQGYLERLKTYAKHIEICGEHRNSYAKTDHDATFMRVKRDYMGNDQLVPAYNVQAAICDEYIAVIDTKQYASDMECFVPLMEKFKQTYGHYPKYPVADAGYGSYNNYIYCEEHGMEKYMKFTMFEKESKDEKYRDNPYRAVNFAINENGKPVCPNGKEFNYLYTRPVKGNKYGRTEELYQCEDCTNCSQCEGNRIIRLNEELTSVHQEVLNNLNSTKGALLRINRSIQAEGAFGTIKWNRAYTRARRRGLKGINFEISLICCAFNLHKYDLKKQAKALTA